MSSRGGIGKFVLAGLVAVSWPPAALAQGVPEHVVTEKLATFPEAFSLIGGLRELSDGRVMIADPLSQVLVLANVSAGSADTLGGVGQGPGEYRQPDRLVRLPADSTLLIDLGNGRLSVIGPEGEFGETMPIARGGPGPGGGLLIVLPRAADAEGRLYFQTFGGGPMGGPPDSAAVVRLDRATGEADTVAWVKRPDMERMTRGGRGDRSVSLRPRPLSPEDAWAVAPDGRVAIARAGERRVEWVHPDGRRVTAEPVAYEPVPVRGADKEEWLEAAANGLRIGIEIENGRRRMAFGRGGGGGGEPDADALDWPESKPPFVANGVWVTSDGETWVERHVPAGQPVRFDVYSADGKLQRSVTLPPGRELAGLGRGTIYLVRSDELGLKWLELYRRPRG